MAWPPFRPYDSDLAEAVVSMLRLRKSALHNTFPSHVPRLIAAKLTRRAKLSWLCHTSTSALSTSSSIIDVG